MERERGNAADIGHKGCAHYSYPVREWACSHHSRGLWAASPPYTSVRPASMCLSYTALIRLWCAFIDQTTYVFNPLSTELLVSVFLSLCGLLHPEWTLQQCERPRGRPAQLFRCSRREERTQNRRSRISTHYRFCEGSTDVL